MLEKSSPSEKPSQRLIESGITNSSFDGPCLSWRDISVLHCLDIVDTLDEMGIGRQAVDMLKLGVRKQILVPCSLEGFRNKALALLSLVRTIQEETRKFYPNESQEALEKVRLILNNAFFTCEPRFRKHGSLGKLTAVGLRRKNKSYLCGLCPFLDCSGICSVPVKSVPKIHMTVIKKTARATPQKEPEENSEKDVDDSAAL